MPRSVTSFHTGYLDASFQSPMEVVDLAIRELSDVDFDTLVGTGVSGTILLAPIAMMMDKNFVVIRRDTDDGHHAPGGLVGNLGKRWVFFDDFVSSGATLRRVKEKIIQFSQLRSWHTEYVGQYCYTVNTDWGNTRYKAAKDCMPTWAELQDEV